MVGECVTVMTVIQAWKQIKKANLIKGTRNGVGKQGCMVMMRNKSERTSVVLKL